MTFDPNKPCVTSKNKYPARIICMDKKSIKGTNYPSPIVALVDFGDEEVTVTYNKNGKHRWDEAGDDLDLINIEEKPESSLKLPITPGRYRIRNGEEVDVEYDCWPTEFHKFKVKRFSGGHFYVSDKGKLVSHGDTELDLIERLPDIHLDTRRSEEKKKVIAAKYEGMPPYDEEELRKTQFESALIELESPLVAPPVEAKIGCWTARGGRKAIVKNLNGFLAGWPIEGVINFNGDWSEITWNTKGRDGIGNDLLTFISPDVEYWEKEGKTESSANKRFSHAIKKFLEPVGDGITDDTEALQAVLDKSKPFDWTQLPASFVVKYQPDDTCYYFPVYFGPEGVSLMSALGPEYSTYEKLAKMGSLWSTDRKTWREFK